MLIAVTRSVDAQDSVSVRGGRRSLLPPGKEILLARSAAPASVGRHATVLILTDTGYAIAERGDNGVTCLVNRSWRDSLEPHCYDAEAATSVLPMELRRLQLRQQGASEAEVARDIQTGLATGRFHPPRRPAMTYMMSAGQVLYDDEGHRVGAWRPHIMIYYPGLKNADVGLAASPDMAVGMVSDEGTAEANLTIVMPAFVPVDNAAATPTHR